MNGGNLSKTTTNDHKSIGKNIARFVKEVFETYAMTNLNLSCYRIIPVIHF